MQESPFSLLVVDDEPAMRRVIKSSLSPIGYRIEEASSGESAIASVDLHSPDIVLLDINMPGIGGIEACRNIRERWPEIGIVMLSVLEREDDKLHAFEAGADDYITKPFRFRELLARVQAVYRRMHREAKEGVLRAGCLELDTINRVLRRDGQEVRLSQKEFDLLETLMNQMDVAVTHARLLKAVWGPEYGGETEYLRTYVKSLRKKIEDDPAAPRYIVTEPWMGYRFCNPDHSSVGVTGR